MVDITRYLNQTFSYIRTDEQLINLVNIINRNPDKFIEKIKKYEYPSTVSFMSVINNKKRLPNRFDDRKLL